VKDLYNRNYKILKKEIEEHTRKKKASVKNFPTSFKPSLSLCVCV
jgi:hypothetical protein